MIFIDEYIDTLRFHTKSRKEIKINDCNDFGYAGIPTPEIVLANKELLKDFKPFWLSFDYEGLTADAKSEADMLNDISAFLQKNIGSYFDDLKEVTDHLNKYALVSSESSPSGISEETLDKTFDVRLSIQNMRFQDVDLNPGDKIYCDTLKTKFIVLKNHDLISSNALASIPFSIDNKFTLFPGYFNRNRYYEPHFNNDFNNSFLEYFLENWLLKMQGQYLLARLCNLQGRTWHLEEDVICKAHPHCRDAVECNRKFFDTDYVIDNDIYREQ